MRYWNHRRLLIALALSLAGCSRLGLTPEPFPPPGSEPLEGFGSATRGGSGGRVITIAEATEKAVRAAFTDASTTGGVVIRFAVTKPIAITGKLPRLTAPGITIEGGGATLDARTSPHEVAIIDIRTHDVIVRDLRVRNGYDNLRVQGPESFNVVIAHVSSTGARDDGISIGYGAHDTTVQYAFLAGNTRSIFSKYQDTTRVSLHHSWMQKGWARNPLFSGPGLIDVRNVIVEDWGAWGSRLEDGASGNVVGVLFTLSPYAHARGGKPDGALLLRGAGLVFTADNVSRGDARPVPPGNASAPLPAPPVHTLASDTMEGLVRARAGCLPRDQVDTAYIALRDGWTVSAEQALQLPPTHD
jgi:hypothetical protein